MAQAYEDGGGVGLSDWPSLPIYVAGPIYQTDCPCFTNLAHVQPFQGAVVDAIGGEGRLLENACRKECDMYKHILSTWTDLPGYNPILSLPQTWWERVTSCTPLLLLRTSTRSRSISCWLRCRTCAVSHGSGCKQVRRCHQVRARVASRTF